MEQLRATKNFCLVGLKMRLEKGSVLTLPVEYEVPIPYARIVKGREGGMMGSMTRA